MRKLIAVVVILIGFSSFAATWTDGNSVEWKYTVADGNVIIDGASGYGSDLVVPETISGKTVVEIRENAFYNCEKIGSVVIPSTVKRIGECAFYGSSFYNSSWMGGYYGSIKTVVISGVKDLTVGEKAFYGQPVTKVDISGINVTIKSNAFYQTYDRSGNNTKNWYGSVKLTGENIVVGDYAFSGLMYREVGADLTGVSSIGEYAFEELGLYYRTSSSTWYEPGNSRVKVSSQLKHMANTAFTRSNVHSFDVGEIDVLFSIDNWAALNPFDCYYFFLQQDGEITYDLNVPEAVNTIPPYAVNNARLSTVTIPATVTNIGEYAFLRTHAKSIDINTSDGFSVCDVGKGAFKETDIESFDIPNNWTNLAASLFCDTKLTSVTIPEGIQSIGNSCFSGCSSLTNVSIPVSCQVLDEYTFSGCKLLSHIDMPQSVKYIGEACFSGCSKLNLSIPGQTEVIGDWAFHQCYKFTEINMPGSVTNIGANAFYGISVKKVNTESLSDWCKIRFKDATSNPTSIAKSLFLNDELVVDVIIPDGVRELHDYVFANCADIQSIVIPASVTKIENNAFYGCTALETVTVSPDNRFYETEEGVLYRKGEWNPLYIPPSTKRLIVREGCTKIDLNLIKNSSALEYVYVPASVTEIDPLAFKNCREKVNLEIDPRNGSYQLIDGVIYTKDSHTAVFGNAGLQIVALLPTVKEVGKYCFDGVSSITNVALNEGLETICDYAFRNCALTSLVVPDTVMSMGSACIGNAKQLENLTVPFVGDVRGFRTIPAYNKRLSYIFGSSGEPTNLKKLTITDETEFYEGCLSYANNDKLEELTIPFIGRKLGAYYGSSSSHFGYVFGAKKHEDNASAVPSSLRKVTITRDTVISSYAFENCGGLEHVIVSSDAISSIGNYAFKNCVGLQTFVVPDSATRIGEGVFYNCSNLTSVTIPNAVTAIGYYAFVSCNALETVCVDRGDIERVKGLMSGRGVSVDGLQFIERDIPVRYTVEFVLGGKGVRVGGGQLHQTVAYGDSAVKPVVSAETGYELAGWDKPTDSISANTTITAIYRPTVYSISYVSTFGNVHDNPTTYTIEDEVVINSVLPFTQGKEFVGWNPSRIEKGSSGNQTVSAEWRTVSLAEGLGASYLTCESVGDARWFVTKIDGKYALQSGVTPDYGISKVSIEVRGEGTLTFTWKASTEIVKTTYIDYGAVLVDGEDVLPHIGGETAWTTRTLTIKGVGLHTIAWEYVKDEMDSGGQDCVWLKDVVWTPDVVVPTLDELGNIFGKDSEVAKYIKDETQLALFNDFLRECSVSSDADFKPAQKQYAYQSFKLKEITSAPQLFEEEPVLKIDDLELSGDNLAVTISLTAGAETIQLAKDKLAEKIRVGTSLDSIVGEPSIVGRPSADGTSLTFEIAPPQGEQGFVKVIIE